MSEKTKTLKKLYEFTIDDDQGKKHKFFVRKASINLTRQGELFHYQTLNSAIKNGLLPQVLISKRFANDSGILSDLETVEYNRSYEKLSEINKELLELEGAAKTEESKTPKVEETKKEPEPMVAKPDEAAKEKPTEPAPVVSKKDKLTLERNNLRKILQQFESDKTSLFNISAESFSRNRVVVWWTLQLSYQVDDKGNETPFYGDGTHEERLAKSDEYEEGEDAFIGKIVKKFLFASSYWFYSGTLKQADFDQASKDFNL